MDGPGIIRGLSFDTVYDGRLGKTGGFFDARRTGELRIWDGDGGENVSTGSECQRSPRGPVASGCASGGGSWDSWTTSLAPRAGGLPRLAEPVGQLKLGGDALEPLDNLRVVGDALSEALDFLFVLGESCVHDAVVAGCGPGFA